MRNRNYGLFAVAAAIVVVGVIWAGFPLATLGLILVCPLMMFFMMRGMGGMGGMGGDSKRDSNAEDGSDPVDRPVKHDHGTVR
jgi:hypothetical protein